MPNTTPFTPETFKAAFPRRVYRDHNGRESVQWREAALDMATTNARLIEALRAEVEINQRARTHAEAIAVGERSIALLAELGELVDGK
jgi:hypothetical protein